MAVATTFVLGPKAGYFFNSLTQWAWHNLPPEVESIFTKTPPIQDVIEFALGTDQAYFISYRDHDGQLVCKHYDLPNPLVEYLYASHPTVVRDVSTLKITLGPFDSYYAWDRTSASWSNVPAGLEKSLLNRLDSQDTWSTKWKAGGYEAPSFVSLGSDGAYFMRTVSGGGCWDLKLPKVDGRGGLGTMGGDGWEGIRGTNKFLEDSSDFTGVAALHLMTTQANAYVLILTNGKAFSNLPEHTWNDYTTVVTKLLTTVHQTAAPAPLHMPPPHVSGQYQPPPQSQHQPPGYVQSQRQQPGNCCPPAGTGAFYPPAPVARPWPMPPINAPR